MQSMSRLTVGQHGGLLWGDAEGSVGSRRGLKRETLRGKGKGSCTSGGGNRGRGAGGRVGSRGDHAEVDMQSKYAEGLCT